ncbi:MAG: glycosyltransferase family 2 protein [Patescibacteria group bacterium]
MHVWIVIPAYNEAKTLEGVLKLLHKDGFHNTLVVDDGSKDKTFEIAKEHAKVAVRHRLNRGLGGALGTGIIAALRMGADYIVTFDADGQHDVKDLGRVLEPLKKGEADAVIGSRLLQPEGMPWFRRIQNRIGNVITLILFGVWTTDSQSGLRAFTRAGAEKIQIKTNRMEVSSEIIHEIGRKKLRFVEVPIKAIYTDYSLSKGQSLFVGIKTLAKLLLHRLTK